MGSKLDKVPLPKPGERNVLITSALPYVNNVPHLGNIIGSVLSADVFARYCRGRGDNTVFVGGTDEFGTTTSLRAMEEGVTPKELCDKYYEIHKGIYEWFNISFDIFGRTTNERHTEITQDVFRELWGKGVVKVRVVEQLWCEKCEGFVFDRLVEGVCPECGYSKARGDQCGSCDCVFDAVRLVEPRCKIDGKTPVRRESKHLFLDIERLGSELKRLFRKKGGSWSENAREIVKGTVRRGLGNFTMCITRDRLDWGTPVPEWLAGFEGKVFYPWWDALLGYISITASGMEEWEEWWRPSKFIAIKGNGDNPDSSYNCGNNKTNPDIDVQLYQFLGADNILFHAILFPATLLALTPPYTALHHIASTNYLTYQGGKFSKSLGVGVFGDNARETGLSADIFRFYLLESRPEGSEDTEFTWDRLIKVNNELLVGKVGKFIGKVLDLLNAKPYFGVVPHRHFYVNGSLPSTVMQKIASVKEDVHRLLGRYVTQLVKVELRGGLETLLELTWGGIAFLDWAGNTCSWMDMSNGYRGEWQAVLELVINLVYLLAMMLDPYIPDTARYIYKVLMVEQPVGRLEEHWFNGSQGVIKPGHKVGKWEEVEALFACIKEEKAKEWEQKFGGKGKEAAV
ncbi:tRNA synthetases class I (M)-domain-containing protein [Triangularia setosa]|uniref:methionine--tRNA ligase n=1 Tax=Triangularia setosa TaxID=2587417 RepID=A0AAN6WJ16_9PEZI|nr:tRNA synthetases class I (M)-domain-containing protein [Podospora setosa]